MRPPGHLVMEVDLLPLPPDLGYAKNGWMDGLSEVIHTPYLCLVEITFLIFQWFFLCSFLHDLNQRQDTKNVGLTCLSIAVSAEQLVWA